MNMLLKLGFGAALAIDVASPTLAQSAAPLGYDPPPAAGVVSPAQASAPLGYDPQPAGATSAAGVVALSADERAAVLERAANGRELPINGAPDRKIHGSMGIEMDSRGGHALYGTAVVPIGETGTAAFSFLTSQGGHYWRH